jgi:hypothetical protein
MEIMGLPLQRAIGSTAREAGDSRAKFSEKFWPLSAVLAWIIWRSPDVVEQCWGTSIEIRAIQKLEPSRPSTTIGEACNKLLANLRQERIIGSAKDQASGEIYRITAEQWMDLWFDTDTDGRDYVTDKEPVPEEGDPQAIWQAIERNEKRNLRYDAPRFCRDDVIRAFPVEPTSGSMEQPEAARVLAAREQPEAAKTGAPGRPSSMHHALRELEDRANRHETAATIAAEAQALKEHVDNLRKEHTWLPPLTERSIRNKIGQRWRELRADAQKRNIVQN